VPDDINILITHRPPKYHLDLCGLGCAHLLSEFWRTRPLLHVFGHIHAGRGQERVHYDAFQRAYEAVCSSRGIMNLFRALFHWALSSYHRADRGSSLLVNAAVTGGFRDREKRDANLVVI
jgi:hypothetical protein